MRFKRHVVPVVPEVPVVPASCGSAFGDAACVLAVDHDVYPSTEYDAYHRGLIANIPVKWRKNGEVIHCCWGPGKVEPVIAVLDPDDMGPRYLECFNRSMQECLDRDRK